MQLVDGRMRRRRRGLASVTLRGTGDVPPRPRLRLGEGILSVSDRSLFRGLVPPIIYAHLSVSDWISPAFLFSYYTFSTSSIPSRSYLYIVVHAPPKFRYHILAKVHMNAGPEFVGVNITCTRPPRCLQDPCGATCIYPVCERQACFPVFTPLHRNLRTLQAALPSGFAPASDRQVLTPVPRCIPSLMDIDPAAPPYCGRLPEPSVSGNLPCLFRAEAHHTPCARGQRTVSTPSESSPTTPASHCHGEGWQRTVLLCPIGLR